VVARSHIAGRAQMDWRTLADELPLIRYTAR